jgi:hypothetical protein
MALVSLPPRIFVSLPCCYQLYEIKKSMSVDIITALRISDLTQFE